MGVVLGAVSARAQTDRGAAWRWYESVTRAGAQLKITRVDTSQAPDLKVHLSLLTVGEGGRLQQLEDPERLEVLTLLMARGEESRPQELIRIEKGQQVPEDLMSVPEEERPPPATLVGMEEAEIPLDLVVVAGGHGGYRAVDRLESVHRDAVRTVLTRLGDARANVIWYGPALYTYRTFEGAQKELSRYDEGLKRCDVERRRLRFEGEEAGLPPCGLLEGKGADMGAALERQRFAGKHARLFGIDRSGVSACAAEARSSTALRDVDAEDVAVRTRDAGAFEEALRLLIRYARPGSRRAIVVLSEGRDGFLDDEAVCRRLFTTADEHCARAAGKKRGKAAREAVLTCVQNKLDERATVLQERWRERAQLWLALMRAADVRVFGLGYAMERRDGNALSYEYERSRLELLSLKSGGTYREVRNPRDVVEDAQAIADEIAFERVLTVGGVLESETPVRIALEATVRVPRVEEGEVKWVRPRVKSVSEVDFVAPRIVGGMRAKIESAADRLRARVGETLFWVIVVVASLLALFLVYKLGKGVVGLGKWIVKKVRG